MYRLAANEMQLSLGVWFDRGARFLLAAVFIYGAVPKIVDLDSFAGIIGAYGLLPEILLWPAALLLVVAEFAAALLLVLGRREGLWLAAALFLLFIAVLSYGIFLGLDIDCGCFGPEDPEHAAFSGLREALLRDILLCIPLGYGYLFHRKKTSIEHGETR